MQQIAAVHEQSQFSFKFRPVDKIPNPLLEMKEITAGYDQKVILSDINFKLSPGSRIALLGENGAGKSTLVKVLADLLKPIVCL